MTPRPGTILRRFARQGPPNVERCELCNAVIPEAHPHLLQLARREVICSCVPCALLFDSEQQDHYRRIPSSVEFLTGFQMIDAEWDSLLIPINVAFFTHVSSVDKVVALYPGPAGVTESLLSLDTWQALVQANPVLGSLQPDVQALLVNRLGATREYYLLGMDRCYQLTGLLRSHWRGLSGGTEVWEKVQQFFMNLKQQADHVGSEGHA